MLNAPPRVLAGDPHLRVWPISVELYHRMIRNGDIEEGAPFELLDGMVVQKDRSKAGEDPMTVGEAHAWAVRKLASLAVELDGAGCFIQTQQPVTIGTHHEPEPDAAIVRGSIDDFRRRHPNESDLLALIEVADASLQRDRTTKLRIYADHGVSMYVILNLVDRVAEVYTQPRAGTGRYDRADTLDAGQELTIPTPTGGPFRVKVEALLP